jgi:hypothetical protein
MSLLGDGALAMWWDVEPSMCSEFEDWHSHEHFPERMSIPGFRRASRWTDTKHSAFFVLYELATYDTLTSPAYLERLNNPTAWSVKMMPHHHNMVRSQCRVIESYGGGVARSMLSIRISPEFAQEETLRSRLRDVLCDVPLRAGLTGGHLLRTETPAIARTTEQNIRGSDGVADWIVLVSAYDTQALHELLTRELNQAALVAAGARPAQIAGLYDLSYSIGVDDFRSH